MNRSSEKTLTHHMPNGSVYVKEIVFTGNPANAEISVVGFDYIAGTNVFKKWTGDVDDWAYSFAEAINAHASTLHTRHSEVNPHPTVYARSIGKKLILIGRIPGYNFTLTATEASVVTLATGLPVTVQTSETIEASGIASVLTDGADGTDWVAISQTAKNFLFINDTGTQIDISATSGAPFVSLDEGAQLRLPVMGNLNEYQFRRTDVATTQVAVKLIWTR